MNTTVIEKSIWAILFLVISNTAMAVQAQQTMPPVFSVEDKAEDILRHYPLGTINTQAAFAHHGGPVRKLVLPNGNPGWLYSTGENIGVPNIYVLQFSKDGIVIDVLHKSLHFKNGHSALQYQFLEKVTPKLIMTGPGPGK